MATDFTGISIFIAVAEAGSFRLASERLGVTRSAVSQSIRRIEDRLGVALIQRTTRSLILTEAGRKLYDRVAPAMSDVNQAIEDAGGEARPSGTLRLAVSSIAERFLDGSLFTEFVCACPDVTLDVTITDETIDIVSEGFDAGVRLGEVLEQDMVALPVSGEQRQIAVASPGYLKLNPAPTHPRDLVGHRCIGWRPSRDVAPYRWEFTEQGRDFAVAVQPAVTTNEMRVMVNTALCGGGITCGMEELFQPYIVSGELVAVLQDYCPPFAGFYLFYPSRRNVPPKLRAFLDHVRRWRQTALR
ncbi:LysR family transcriptional regulator [Rhizobium sp. Root483D2]|uniref:LysR family transcriptional regulator n=1 Tax=Rhizobium sp. Root483D2 TaxID=1736545 RepID=UPI000715173C|nr:LysR family transcriptional regulator [Rhizobium sp. Root483D2]KQY42468.1 LysR family transcriptional regulator [Rhizobium sp. Root483D2]